VKILLDYCCLHQLWLTCPKSPFEKLKRSNTCQTGFGGGVGDKPTVDVNSIQHLRCKRGKWYNSFCLFIILQTCSQVRHSLKITLMSRSHMACNGDIARVA
jgi:hypothetical protein